MSDIFGVNKKEENDIDKKIANSLEKLTEGILNITEFNANELKSISVLLTDYRMKKYLQSMLVNKKHIKRKHSDELLKALKLIAVSIAHSNSDEPDFSFNDKTKFFGRR